MSWLITIDPGLRGCGCALWRPNKMLDRAKYVVAHDGFEGLAPAVARMANAVRHWQPVGDGSVVIEIPQTYGGRAKKGDANDLIALGAVCGALLAQLGRPTTFVTPHEWKGSTPKEVTARQVKDKLTAEEWARVEWPTAKGLRHNVIDGIGIGLAQLGR